MTARRSSRSSSRPATPRSSRPAGSTPEFPRSLERICLKAMAADPKSRFPSADALRLALRRYRLTRRAAPVFAAAAVLLALLVSDLGILASARTPLTRRSRAVRSPVGETTEPQSEPSSIASGRPAGDPLRDPPFPQARRASTTTRRRAGLLGRRSFAARVDDDVTVQAELSEPAYSYLIAFRPDGTDELCDPDDEDTPPPQETTAAVPAPRQERRAVPPERGGRPVRLRAGRLARAAALVSRVEEAHRTDGVGRQAAVRAGGRLARRRPGPSAAPGRRQRRHPGQGRQGPRLRESAAKLASWLRGLPGVDVVTLEAFPVEPASGP